MSARLTLALAVLGPAVVGGVLWTSRSFSPLRGVGPAAPIAVTADFDGDGIPDRAVLRDTSAEVTLSSRHATIRLRALPRTTALAAADIDHDGDVDLVSIGDTGLRGWTNQRSGSFEEWTAGPPDLAQPLHVAAVHWTSGAPLLFPATTGRSRTDVFAGGISAPGPQLKPQISRALDVGRGPPRLIAFDRPSRAPPRNFIS